VQTPSSDIERTASIWLPKYEAKKERRCYLWNSPRGVGREKFGNDYKLQGQALTLINKGRPGEVPGLGGHLTIEQQQESSAKSCQRTNICLEGGRIDVNVSHHSTIVNLRPEKNLFCLTSLLMDGHPQKLPCNQRQGKGPKGKG
jgi:hypothetical protein